MKQTVLLFFYFLLSGLSVWAQSDYRPGYILNSTGDTIPGLVDYRRDSKTWESCSFKPNASSGSRNIQPAEYKGYGFDDGRRFTAFQIKDGDQSKMVFLEVLFKGRINLYYLRESLTERFFIQKEELGLVELSYSEEYIDKNGADFLYQSKRHIGMLKYYMNDAPSLNEEIERMKKPSMTGLISLMQDYQKLFSREKDTKVYRRKSYPFKLNPELTVGSIRYTDVPAEVSSYKIIAKGVYLHCWLPWINERLYLETGALWVKANINDTTGTYSQSYWKIPIRAEYVMPSKIIQPYFSLGTMIYSSKLYGMGDAISVSGGVRIRLNKYIRIGITPEVDFEPNTILHVLPKRIANYTIRGGLYLNL